MDIEEFAPHMCPAASLDNPTAGEEFIEPGPRVRLSAGPRTGAAVSVNDAAKVLQMRLRMLAPRLRGGRLLRSGE